MKKENDLKKLRIKILDMAYASGEGHIPSSFSVLEILYTIYSNLKEEDKFFLSKGHASLAFYTVLAHFGYIEWDELEKFGTYYSALGGHPHRNTERGIVNSSGSLGHGLAMAVGYALGKKIKGESGNVFCLIGDGECNEGLIWEAALYASHLNLLNLVCVVDNNNSQTRAVPSKNLTEKFKSFGWEVREVKNGHSVEELEETIFRERLKEDRLPFCVIAHTKKGKGIREMEENMFAWHHKAPIGEEYERFKKEIFEL